MSFLSFLSEVFLISFINGYISYLKLFIICFYSLGTNFLIYFSLNLKPFKRFLSTINGFLFVDIFSVLVTNLSKNYLISSDFKLSELSELSEFLSELLSDFFLSEFESDSESEELEEEFDEPVCSYSSSLFFSTLTGLTS